MGAPRKPVDPYRSAAALWGALARRFRDLYGDRHLVPLSAEELADRVGYTRQTIYAIENGEHVPGDRAKAALWDEAVDAGGVLLMLWPLASQLGTTPLQDYLARKEAAYSEARRRSSALQEEDRVERRQLLQLALAGLGAGSLMSVSEPVRQLLERAVGPLDAIEAGAARDLAEWDLTCLDHMHAVLSRPPAQVIPDLVVDLLALERSLDTADERTTADLQRFAARLSAVHANALTRLGDHGSALRWWRTARQAADTSGDVTLSAWVRATEAIFGLYGQRAPSAALTIADQAIELVENRPCAGLAKARGARSQALAVLGRSDEAKQELVNLRETAEGLEASDSEFGWVPDGMHFAESWVYALAGDEGSSDAARELVIRRSQDRGCYQNVPNVRLHEAVAAVAAGGVDQGVRTAAAIIDGVPPAYRSQMIIETGRLVVRTVPIEHSERPAVRELQEVLTGAPGAVSL